MALPQELINAINAGEASKADVVAKTAVKASKDNALAETPNTVAMLTAATAKAATDAQADLEAAKAKLEADKAAALAAVQKAFTV